MKVHDLQNFERALNATVPVYAIIVDDDFERNRATALLKKSLSDGKEEAGLSFRTFWGDSLVAVGSILEELDTSSMFAERAVAIIYQIEKLGESCIDALYRYCMDPNGDNPLVVVGKSLSASSLFYRQVEKMGVLLHIPVEKDWRKEKTLTAMMIQKAEEAGKNIDVSVCQKIIRQVGVDGGLIEQELEKLICYAGERAAITDEDVARICSSVNTGTVWGLAEAIFYRRLGHAMTIGKGIINDGFTVSALLAQLRKQFQTGYLVCSILADGGGPQEVTAKFGYMRGRILKHHMRMAQNYGTGRFKRALVHIDNTLVATRNSAADPIVLLEMLLIKLAS